MADIIIENIVATTNIAKELDIEHLANAIQDSKYNPEEFSGLSIYFDEPKAVVFIFSNGKITCTGVKNIDDIEDLIIKTINKMEEAGISIMDEPEVEIENIVVSSDIKKELNLLNISKNPLLEKVEYRPEQFPGLVYRTDDPNIILLIFSSGKIVCTGAKKLEDASNAINTIEDKLKSMGIP